HRLAVVPNQFLAPFISRIMVNWYSRMGSNAERRRALVTVIGILAALLAIAAVFAVLLADPIVPFLFGPAWAGAADILTAMAGIVLFTSLFETLRGFCLSQRRSRTLLLGRAMLYVVFFGAVGLLMLFHAVDAFNLGMALSCAVMASFLVMVPGTFRRIPEAIEK
ncbi:MAG: oligosaccharide flippase family protein, partial [Rhodospirillales bacterium]